MIQDELLMFSKNAAVSTAGTGRARVGSTLDMAPVGAARNVGNFEKQLYLLIQVRTAFTSAGAATTAFSLVSDGVTPTAVDGTATEHVRTPAYALAQLVPGFRVEIPLPPGNDRPYERYLGLHQDVGVAALTAGAVDAFLTTDPPSWKPLTSA